jgi:uncharacterized membrane protein
MKRMMRYSILGCLWLATATFAYGQDTSKVTSAIDSVVVKLDSAQSPSAAVAVASDSLKSISNGLAFNSPIAGTPFSLLSLLLVGMVLITALVTAMMILLEQNLANDLARIRSMPGENTYHAKLSRMLQNTKTIRKFWMIGMSLFIAGFWLHQQIKGTPWEGHLNEWMNLIVRWAHITFGVAWIGASFYFIFLENALYRGPGIREGLAGNLWAIHGGGFYYVEKYKVAPPKLPAHLHWFKWEAYITWISGISLLAVVYYFNASSLLVDKNIADISSGTAIAIGISTLVLSWVVYDLLCKSPLVESKPVFFFIMLAYITLIAFFLTQWLSPRAAYIHVGAVIGTMMAGNVWRVIIPSQKAMVKAAEEGREVNPELGRHAGLRSLHNNYFTLPVLFIMISNHFPSTYGNTMNWAVLGALTLISAGVKHYFNLKDKGQKSPLLIPAATIGMMIVFFYTAPRPKSENTIGGTESKVEFYQVYQTITRRCTPCHSANPTDDANIVAPNGIMMDSPDQILALKDRIMVRAVETKTMPQANKTQMTDEERALIGRWVAQGGLGF